MSAEDFFVLCIISRRKSDFSPHNKKFMKALVYSKANLSGIQNRQAECTLNRCLHSTDSFCLRENSLLFWLQWFDLNPVNNVLLSPLVLFMLRGCIGPALLYFLPVSVCSNPLIEPVNWSDRCWCSYIVRL